MQELGLRVMDINKCIIKLVKMHIFGVISLNIYYNIMNAFITKLGIYMRL